MSLVQIQETVTLTQINCGECGGTYALNERYRAQQYEKGGSWHCPYCQVAWGYANNNENSKLKKELEIAKRNQQFYQNNAAAEREARERTERRLAATKGAKTKLRNRIKHGVCPCCTRTFLNLQRHIAHQHPDFQADDEASPSSASGSQS